jgi:hypothetical protein
MVLCTCYFANGMVIKCKPLVNMPHKKMHVMTHFNIKVWCMMKYYHELLRWLRCKMYDIMVHIYILYDIFIRVSKNERHRLGWMKSWNWNLVATSIIRKIHQELGRILWYASMLRNENTRSYEIEVEHW